MIIVNWNGKRHLPDCLDSLTAQTFGDFETILVDNASADGSLEFVAGRYPWVKTVALPVNRGFAGGNNEGFLQASGKYIITMNNDTVAAPVWIEELVRAADHHPGAGMIASRVCSHGDPDVIDSLGVKVCRDGMSMGAFRSRRFPELNLKETEEILLPSACAALYRRRMLDEIGFFDEDFFAYCEDTDLGLRGRWAGWKALPAGNAVIYHKYSQTAGSFSPLKLYLVERNHYWVAAKNYPFSWLVSLPLSTCVRYCEQTRAILRGKGAGAQFLSHGKRAECASALFRGLRDGLRQLPAFLRKRAAAAGSRKLKSTEMRQLLKHYAISARELLDAG